MTTDQKTPGQVRADFEAAFPRWEGDKGMASAWVGWEACARNLAHDRANQPAASGVWIPVSERLPAKRERDYQVLTLASKRHVGGNYHGEPIAGINQDWVVRAHVENFDSWCEIPPLPAAPEAPKP